MKKARLEPEVMKFSQVRSEGKGQIQTTSYIRGIYRATRKKHYQIIGKKARP